MTALDLNSIQFDWVEIENLYKHTIVEIISI